MGATAVETKTPPTRDELIRKIKDKHAELGILVKGFKTANSKIQQAFSKQAQSNAVENLTSLIEGTSKVSSEIEKNSNQIIELVQTLIKISAPPKISIKQAVNQIQIFFEYHILPFEPKSIGTNIAQSMMTGNLRDDLMQALYETNLFHQIDVRGNMALLHYKSSTDSIEFLTQEAVDAISSVMTLHGFSIPIFNNID